MLFDLPQERSSIIKVIGIGGGGCNAVNHMFQQGIQDVNFVVCNTDHQALDASPVPNKIQLGPELTKGRGAGSHPEMGREASMESIAEIKEILSANTEMVFITAGMGGGTGTGGAPVVAKIAKEMGVLTVGIVTMPFNFEGRRRVAQAVQGIEELKEHVDSILVIVNDKIREVYGNLGFSEAFARADDVLTTAAKGIAEIITIPGYVNVDFEDVKTVLSDSGVAIMGTGIANGENRAIDAVERALSSPLLNDTDISGARNVLLNITSGQQEVRMDEISEITEYVQDAAGNESDIIWGNCRDENLGDEIMVTVIATGFEGGQEEEPKSEVRPEVIVHDLTQSSPEAPAAPAANEPVLVKREMPKPVVPGLPVGGTVKPSKPLFRPVAPEVPAQPEQQFEASPQPAPQPAPAPENPVSSAPEVPSPEETVLPFAADPQQPIESTDQGDRVVHELGQIEAEEEVQRSSDFVGQAIESTAMEQPAVQPQAPQMPQAPVNQTSHQTSHNEVEFEIQQPDGLQNAVGADEDVAWDPSMAQEVQQEMTEQAETMPGATPGTMDEPGQVQEAVSEDTQVPQESVGPVGEDVGIPNRGPLRELRVRTVYPDARPEPAPAPVVEQVVPQQPVVVQPQVQPQQPQVITKTPPVQQPQQPIAREIDPDADEISRRSAEQRRKLRGLSLKLNNVEELEKTPAYMRRNVHLSDVPPSGEEPVSRYQLSPEKGEDGPEFQKRNSFLHDNVD